MKSHKLFIFIYYLLNCTWGIIQNTFAFIVFLIINIQKKRIIYRFNGAIVTVWDKKSSMGCGMFIFFGHKDAVNSQEILIHEYGHTVQSMILGPLFMPIIGIPSFIWAWLPIFVKQRKQRNISYFSFYPEKWANSIGAKTNNYILKMNEDKNII